METLADLNASGSNLAPHMQIRTREQMCLHASLRLSCTSDLCRRWRYTSENWDSFNCSMNAAIDTFVDTVTFCVETKQKYGVNTSIFIHGFSIHPSWRGQKPARLGKLPVLRGWRVSAQLGPEHPSTQGRHEAKDILISTLPPAALLMQALAGYLRRIK